MQARKCVMIFDNYGENKNTINIAFLSHLVMKGWKDEFIILYGMVGHTHNGVDRDHKDHNQLLGAFFSATFVVTLSLSLCLSVSRSESLASLSICFALDLPLSRFRSQSTSPFLASAVMVPASVEVTRKATGAGVV